MRSTDWADVDWAATASPPPSKVAEHPRVRGLLQFPEIDPGHLLLPDEWAAVVAEAERITAEAEERRKAVRYGAGTGPNGTVTAKFHGGKMAGAPTFVVIHDAETPLADGYVASIAEMFRRGPAAGTSAHHMVGPRTWLQLLPEDVIAYAAGAKANPRGIHIEQTGYAAFTPAQWITADGLAQVARLADCVRAACDRWGIPKRWLTDDQLRLAAVGKGPGGLTTHQQVARVLKGTTHTDPEKNYPRDLLLDAVIGSAPTPSLQEDDTVTLTLFRHTRSGAVYLGAAGVWHPTDPLFLATLQVLKVAAPIVEVPTDAHLSFAQWYCTVVLVGGTSQRLSTPRAAALGAEQPTVPDELRTALQAYVDKHPELTGVVAASSD